ncbi:MAG TPA: tRNA uridine-5-carboxymethylaminomethyl(34) synthesis GTPase MnmE [Burkholderiales bacterium]|nr:tRNA uridine-5-carboxymethylaminomethyl(34) synthesis GTPase MnmE [Burkholderiales bacterium]
MNDEDIIAAIATAPGRGGIGVVRVSGPRLQALITGVAGGPLAPRRAAVRDFIDARGEIIDQGLALFFPAPQSYTGQDVLELQAHGGPIVLQLLLARCLELGARAAQPGEFTRRAYLNDKLDLAQAESVADLIDAATAAAARGALRSLRGAFSERVDELVRGLIELRTLVEASLDFPDEEVDFIQRGDGEGRLSRLRAKLEEVLSASRQGSLLREGMHIVLAGQPNVGKSSLLNQLAGEDLAIVTEIPGTTRDAVRQSINLDGVPAHIIDTAGLRDSSDPVERLGIARTWAAIERADLVLMLMDATLGETPADRDILKKLPATLSRIQVWNKIDLLGQSPGLARSGELTTLRISAKTGVGMDLLKQALLESVGWQAGSGEGLFMARARHVQALTRAGHHLASAARSLDKLELFAEELRLAQTTLGTITGEFTPDDLLGEIFSRFCIGK